MKTYIYKYLDSLASVRSILSLSMANNSEKRTDNIDLYFKHKIYPEGYGNSQKKRMLRGTPDIYVTDEALISFNSWEAFKNNFQVF